MITQLLYLIKYGLPSLIDLLLNFVQEVVFLFKWLFVALEICVDLSNHVLPVAVSTLLGGILALAVLFKVFGREG